LQPQAVTLTSSANPSRFGAPISLTATLSNPGSATGVIAFLDGATLLGSRTVTAGTASISVVLLPAGIRKLRAFYSGDTNYVSATSNVSGQTVNAVAGGTLVSQNLVSLPVAPSSVALGDFNGDAKADFAFANSIPDTNPWWQVDLGATIGIDSVAIWNRTDCCGSRLSDYWLFISNTPFQATDTPATLQGRAGVFASHQTVAPNPSATIPAFTQGRYVRVQLSGANYLSLAEVQVFSLSSNVALHKAATQSSTYQGLASAAASAAVDGNTDGNFSDGSISSTDIAISGVMVALGQGDGTFQPPVTYPTGMTTETSIAVGDFNGDGSADLAVSGTVGAVDTPLPVVSILLGNSDGTFRPAVKYPAGTLNPVLTGSFPAPAGTTGPLVVGDFNGDGRADLFVIDNISQFFGCGGDQPIPCGVNHFTVSYLLTGNGDGSFNLAVFSGAPAGPYAIADFDGDGKPDIATSLGVTLGSGRFAPFSQALAIAPSAFAADLNGDGKPDLVTGNVILLGNGDGSFRPPATYAFAAAVNSGDFNGDGIADLVVVDSVGNLAGIWYGNGDGSFRQGLTINGGAPLAVADFSGDGRADILTASSGGARVVLGAVTGAFTLTATGGTPQSAVVGTPFAAPLQVTVLNNGSPASGITVVFSAPTVGPSATLSASQAVTNALGVATVTATANNIPGTYVVTATVGAVSTTFSLTNLPGQNSNLAQGKTATQSSTLGYPTAIAASAVDGNTNGGFFAGSVTATNLDPNAWWQVDLGASVTVGAIVIWNRTDCCGARLNDYWVFVSNTPFLATDTPATLQNRAGTFANHQTSAPNPSFIVMPIVQGRYVRVQLSGTDYLSLAEVQVFGNAAPLVTNVAQGKPAVQSSTLAGAPTAIASSAVDGNSDGSFFNGSVTATNLDSNAWWQVDLGGSASISSIVIFNRTDCCSSRLSDFWVFVSDTPFLASDTPATLQNRVGTFVSHQTSAPNPSTTITLNTQGRYVRVQLSGADYLSLAEVQVFGTGAPAISNVAQGKSAAQSSTLPGIPSAAAGSAVDGNTDGNFYDGSVTATNLDPNPWWQVDLGVSRAISSIVIYNRTDCCGSRLSDYWVFVSDTPFLATDTPATLQYRPGTFANYQTTAPNPSTSIANAVQGRYVRVQLSSADYLSLAEVQVFGQ
jgi:hypothetical protein